MLDQSIRSAWSNLEKAIKEATVSKKSPAPRSRSTTYHHTLFFKLPKRIVDRFAQDLSNARCEDNGIEKFMNKKFEEHILKSIKEDCLNLSHMNLKRASARIIGNRLRDDDKFIKINLSNNPLQDEGLYIIAKSLSYNVTLIHLDISRSSLTPHGFIAIFPHFHQLQALISLNLSYNHLSQKGSEALQEFAKSHQTIQFLDISSTFAIPIKGNFAYLNLASNAIHSTKFIEASLDLQLQNNYFEAGLGPLCRRIQSWTIIKLNLTNTQLRMNELDLLMESIQRQSHLEYLNLSQNCFPGQLISVCNFLTHNHSLVSLIMRQCQICEFAKISEGLKENRTLKLLDLSFNQIGVFGAGMLSQNINKLETIILNGCDIKQGINTILERLVHAENLKCIEISDNLIEDFSVMMNMLKKNKNIIQLDYSKNFIHFQQQREIEKLLKHNRSLQKAKIIPKQLKNLEELTEFNQQQDGISQSQLNLSFMQASKENQLEKAKNELQLIKNEEQKKTQEYEQRFRVQFENLQVLINQEEDLLRQKEQFYAESKKVIEGLKNQIENEEMMKQNAQNQMNKALTRQELLNSRMPLIIKQLQKQEQMQCVALENAQKIFEQL